MNDRFDGVKEKFKDGDWIFGLGAHKGCSEVFTAHGVVQPFSYLDDYNPDNFRIATPNEVLEAKSKYI